MYNDRFDCGGDKKKDFTPLREVPFWPSLTEPKT
jgi:hypothetical protein